MTRQATVQATLLALALAALAPAPAMAQVPTGRMEALRPDQQQFLDFYRLEVLPELADVTTG